jgi:hypothetical protein
MRFTTVALQSIRVSYNAQLLVAERMCKPHWGRTSSNPVKYNLKSDVIYIILFPSHFIHFVRISQTPSAVHNICHLH